MGARRRARLRADLATIGRGVTAALGSARVVSVAGISSGAGVTTLTTWLATTLADAGRRVLLVEANRTTPRLHRLFGFPRSPGATEALAGKIAVARAVAHGEDERLSLLGSGVLGEQIVRYSRDGWVRLLADVREDGTLVLIDAGPVEVGETLAVAAASDATILVVEAGRTRRRAVVEAVERLRGAGAALLGVVLNEPHRLVPALLARGA